MKQILRVYDIALYSPEEALKAFGHHNKEMMGYFNWYPIAIIDDERTAEAVKTRLYAEQPTRAYSIARGYSIEFDIKPLNFWKKEELYDVYLQIEKISTSVETTQETDTVYTRTAFCLRIFYQDRCNEIIEVIKAVSRDVAEQAKPTKTINESNDMDKTGSQSKESHGDSVLHWKIPEIKKMIIGEIKKEMGHTNILATAVDKVLERFPALEYPSVRAIRQEYTRRTKLKKR